MSGGIDCQEHDFATAEVLDCVPPIGVLQFGEHAIDPRYRDALHSRFPFYTTEEVVGSFLGHNPYFPSQEEWLEDHE
tara:strand:+ start:2091 stop:2321 length:231 start_codon:yes stop_codon:yes gene_type:complete